MAETKRVLVVEDEWLLASELSRKLVEAGYGVVGPVATVGDAVERLQDGRPDVAVLDVQLDGETTLALVPLLTERRIPLLFLSGHSTQDYPDLKPYTVLSKPAEWVELFRTLEVKLRPQR
jgi:DNA-binding response OmpR family regulator